MKPIVWTLILTITVLAVAPSAFACGMSKSGDHGGEEAETSAE